MDFKGLKIKHFKESEFRSKDGRGPEKNFMDEHFVHKLDKARAMAGIPFVINSGYRTPEHNEAVGGVKNSAHIKKPCAAADIEVGGSRERYLILRALLNVGLNRIGIGSDFIHVDMDETKHERVIWMY